tara:strand:- start:44 stop:415 length:372 start_codon:yes stop_codon:yes gene_type:complete
VAVVLVTLEVLLALMEHLETLHLFHLYHLLEAVVVQVYYLQLQTLVALAVELVVQDLLQLKQEELVIRLLLVPLKVTMEEPQEVHLVLITRVVAVAVLEVLVKILYLKDNLGEYQALLVVMVV